VALHTYLAEHHVHLIDCAGHVDWQEGLRRLDELERALAAHPLAEGASTEDCRKLLIDFRATTWDCQETHMRLSSETRLRFGLNETNTRLRVAIINNQWTGLLAQNEHWFQSKQAALEWLAN